MLLELGIEAVWAAQPEDMSLLHVLFYIHSAGSLEMLFDTEGGAQQDRFVGGSQRIPLLMAQALGDENVMLGRARANDPPGDHGVTVEADGATVRARQAIVAVAPTLAGRIAYDPPLPGYRDQLTQRMPLGTVAKCMAIYDEPFWRAEGLSGQGTSDAGPVKLTFDNSPPDGTPGVLLGFLEGRQARELGRLPAGGAPRRGGRLLRPPVRPARRAPGRLCRAALGRGGVVARLLRLPHADRRLDQLRPRAARADRPAALGRRRVLAPSGTATWTARSAPARPRPAPCSSASASPFRGPQSRYPEREDSRTKEWRMPDRLEGKRSPSSRPTASSRSS